MGLGADGGGGLEGESLLGAGERKQTGTGGGPGEWQKKGRTRFLVRRFFHVAGAFFVGDARWKARRLLALLVLFACGSTGMHVLISFVRKDFTNALTEKSPDRFYTCVWRFAGIIAVAAPFFALYEYLQGQAVLEWRLWLTNVLLAKYFANRAFFDLKMEGALDNPDQRICEDVSNFVKSSVTILKALIEKVLSILAFSAVLWSIAPSLVAFLLSYALLGTLVTLRLFGRKLMWLKFEGLQREADMRYALVRVRDNVESIAFYRGEQKEAASISALLARLVHNIRQRLAWDFALSVFTNAYNYATFLIPGLVLAPRIFSGELRYGDVLQTSMAFREIFRAVTVIVLNFDTLSSLAAETERLESLLAALGLGSGGKALSPGSGRENGLPSSAGPSPLGLLSATTNGARSGTQNSGALPAASSDVPSSPAEEAWTPKQHGKESPRTVDSEQTSQLGLRRGKGSGDGASYTVAVERGHSPLFEGEKASLLAGSDGARSLAQDSQFPGTFLLESRIQRRLGRHLAVEGLRIYLPKSGEVLFPSGLSFHLDAGQSLLVMGPSGCGKSSLLRVISGLWSSGEGLVECLRESDTFFLPQKPYMTLGSLREQLLFPQSISIGGASDAELLELLRQVSLPDLAKRFPAGLDEDRDWSSTLSFGEQQRVAFARLLLHRPQVAFLDEATSALDTANEKKLYSFMQQRVPSYVSVGHRISLISFHTHVLWFDEDQQMWTLTPSEEFKDKYLELTH